MKVAVIAPLSSHSTPFLMALAQGITASGDHVHRTDIWRGKIAADAAVCWGWRRAKGIRRTNPDMPVLVMERGYVGDRFHWTSLGWNGLNGHAIFPKAPKPPAIDTRWQHFVGWKPWREFSDHRALQQPGTYALILGQVQSDQACTNVNLPYQYRAWMYSLSRAGHKVKFRPHPKAMSQGSGLERGCYTRGTLAEDLAGAKFTVSWNSNSSVDSVLAGVPSVTLDRGAMAWSVTSHDLRNPVTMPNRTEWAAQLAWCQWQPSELSDGTAWKAVRDVKP